MRIVHLSDIHLGATNLDQLTNFYMKGLLSDLTSFHSELPIDFIFITGDLVDQGGSSLGDTPYEAFQEKFIDPIASTLGIETSMFLFVPGNHDIDRNKIEIENEYYLTGTLTKEKANDQLKEQYSDFQNSNERIKKFKLFEKNFYSGISNYNYTNNESSYTCIINNTKVGFAMINDSWRCSEKLEKKNHFVGTAQIFNCIKYFDKEKVDLKISLFHHPLEAINQEESEVIENILASHNFIFCFSGHHHKIKYSNMALADGQLISLRGRMTFGNPTERDSVHQPGYSIIDIDPNEKKYKISARKFIISRYAFDKDVDSFTDGVISGTFRKQNNVSLTIEDEYNKNDLPTGYSADVNRIVRLLIGKSIYPDPKVFVRELIQNAVDACNRRSDNECLQKLPLIIVHFNIQENYVEFQDGGDGMTKSILKNHFSVIGKSISQELIDSDHGRQLISKFGIGFISTFIVARKVMVTTKTFEDGAISFEINDVFKGFIYGADHLSGNLKDFITGTIIRVYLKLPYRSESLVNDVFNFCRHVENLIIKLNHNTVHQNRSWNIEQSQYQLEDTNSRFTLKLGISANPRHLIASNAGFLLSLIPTAIIPYRLPHIIGGEINFNPNEIDFDISRTNILVNQKSMEIRKHISNSVRILFRLVTEGPDNQLKTTVLNYIIYYLNIIDGEENLFAESYIDFYSKQELLSISYDLFVFRENWPHQTLREMLTYYKTNNLEYIYMFTQNKLADIDKVAKSYLNALGFMVVQHKNVTVQFHSGPLVANLNSYLSIVATENNLKLKELKDVSEGLISDLVIPLSKLPTSVQAIISKLQSLYSLNIKFAKLGNEIKSSLFFNSNVYLNVNSSPVSHVINSDSSLIPQEIELYLRGVLSIMPYEE